eukprot:1158655-Pelagomonas_calceolata.AAC.7
MENQTGFVRSLPPYALKSAKTNAHARIQATGSSLQPARACRFKPKQASFQPASACRVQAKASIFSTSMRLQGLSHSKPLSKTSYCCQVYMAKRAVMSMSDREEARCLVSSLSKPQHTKTQGKPQQPRCCRNRSAYTIQARKTWNYSDVSLKRKAIDKTGLHLQERLHQANTHGAAAIRVHSHQASTHEAVSIDLLVVLPIQEAGQT